MKKDFFWLKFVVQLPLTDIFKLFRKPHLELYQRSLLRLASENSFYWLISAFFNVPGRQQTYVIREDSVRQPVKDEFYPGSYSVFHQFVWWETAGLFSSSQEGEDYRQHPTGSFFPWRRLIWVLLVYLRPKWSATRFWIRAGKELLRFSPFSSWTSPPSG